jgi:hypothetical protein
MNEQINAITTGDWPRIIGPISETDEISLINESAELLFSEGDEKGARVVLENILELTRLRAAIQDLAAHVWRGDWDKLKPETRAALGEKE